MFQESCCADLLLKATQPAGVRGDGGRQDLDRHVAPDARVASAIDLSHSGIDRHDEVADPSVTHGTA